jgi:prolyl 4-hydroxylase
MQRRLIDGERISVIEGFLSATECDTLIERAEQYGFKPSPLSGESPDHVCLLHSFHAGGGHGRTHREDARNNHYTVITDSSLADQLFKRVAPHLPQTLDWMSDNAYLSKGNGGREWSIAGCVDRLRFYKYERDEEYPEHMDGSYSRTITTVNGSKSSRKQHSFLTLLIYLNDDFQGGQTKFYPDKEHCRFLRDIEDKQPIHQIQPRRGMALINVHQILHDGAKIQSGVKYVLRTDILYEKKIEPHAKLSKFTTSENSTDKEEIIVGEWQKHFEPSCKMYHD